MTTTVQTGTAGGYFRVRSPGQAGERHVSLEVQDAAFRDDCQQHLRTPLAVFIEQGYLMPPSLEEWLPEGI